MPQSPAGQQLRWWLDSIAQPETMTAADVIGRYADLWPKSPWWEGDDAGRAAWKADWDRFGRFEIESIEDTSPTQVAIVLAPESGRRRRITFKVEESPPHRIVDERWERVYDFDLEIRPATEADAAVLSDIERRGVVVLGDTSVATDRGDDYFAAARLIDGVTVFLATIDGDPAAVAWGAQAPVHFDGKDQNATYFFHLRVTPEHQRKGMWGAMDGAVWNTYGATSDIYIGYWLAENTAWAHVAEGVIARPDFVRRDWVPTVYRLLLPTASIATTPDDRIRRATPDDAPRIVELINACHEGQHFFRPYTEETLAARLARDPSYGWSDLLLSDHAVVGVWRAGDTIEVVTDTAGTVTRNRRGHVLDLGFTPGAAGEGELAALLGAAGGDLDRRGIDQLSVFTSRGARTQPVLRAFKGAVEAYCFNTGAAAMIPDEAQTTGISTDHLYF
jgi:hypothetical protein